MTIPILPPIGTRRHHREDLGGGIAELWKNIIPYADLNAKGIPERNLELGTEVLPTLAVLAAQSATGPRLLSTDLLGNLIVASTGYLVDKLTAPLGLGASTLQVTNPAQFAAGMSVSIGSVSQLADKNPSYQTWISQVNPDSLITQNNSPAIFPVGTFVVGIPFQQSRYGYTDKLPFVFQDSSAPGPGLNPVVNEPAFASTRYRLNAVVASLINNGGLAEFRAVRIYNGTVAGGVFTTLGALSVSATAGDKDHIVVANLSHIFTLGNEINITFDAATGANNLGTIYAAGYRDPAPA